MKYIPGRWILLPGIACGILLIVQMENGLAKIFTPKGRMYQEAGKWVEEYGKTHFPGKQIRVYEYHMSQVVYWSKAVHANGYDCAEMLDPRTSIDFDLAVIQADSESVFGDRKDIQLLEDAPYPGKMKIYRRIRKDSGKDTK